ncbi:hypothetical protein [Arthrobacter sp. 2MCAF14]|uniref:hypothetical protein n=1 Tax=Arthrobacter sp. 2MCAF14 TaxID=3232982 RepID=UPI003F8F4589
MERIFPFASCAKTSGSASPAINAASMARADTVVTDEATEEISMLASSSIFSNRPASLLLSPISCTR